MDIVFKPIYFSVNQGHGNARRKSLNGCSNELVALMDADDISLPNRFEKQIQAFIDNTSLSIIGGQISEFIGSPTNVIGRRVVPEKDEDIKHYMKKRCPMNQVSVMLKKEKVEESGGYIDWYCDEDYYLWLRMAKHNAVFANLPDILVNVRVGNEMSSRRGGWKYFSSEAKLQAYMLKEGVISFPRFLYNTVLRFGGEVVVPNKLRTKLFRSIRTNDKIDTLVSDITRESISTIDKNNEDYPPFSVAMCVYGKDNAEWFDIALESVIIKQSVKPSEVVLVVDGPVPDSIHAVIKKYEKICGGGELKVIEFSENKGLGKALEAAIEKCTYDLIARMDSDDIAVENRFELQLKKMRSSDIDICGGQIEEFIGDIGNVAGRRLVPETDAELKAYIKMRCPFNHMTVMYKKSAVLRAGNYMDWFWNEDYYLWIRMALADMKFANLPEILVHVRVGKDMYARRGGKKYFQSETKLQKYMLDKKMISLPTYIENVGKRVIVQVLLSNNVRAWVFKHFARN